MKPGPIIRRNRKQLKLRQVDCARMAGMVQSQWSQIETDRGSPLIKTLERVAIALGCRVSDLL